MNYSAGKVTIATALTAVFIFCTIFLLDVGRYQFQTVSAQNTATTTLTVRNLPPVWVTEAFEQTPSDVNNPINSGGEVVWEAEATNNMDYWLIICSTSATPTPTAAANAGDQGNPANAPNCSSGIRWAVSDPTPSGAVATAATTTTDDRNNPFGEINEWYGWLCDDDAVDPRCTLTFSQGASAGDPMAESPFVVNFRPTLVSVTNDGPTLPGDEITYTSVSFDDDVARTDDEIILHVCATNFFDNGACEPNETLASSTGTFTENATASFTLPGTLVSYTFEAFVFLVDEFDHVATNTIQADFDVANATPTIAASSIVLNNGDDMNLTEMFGTTTGFTLEVTVQDDNSCVAVDSNGDSLGAGSEFADLIVSVFRESIGTSTCDGTAGPFDENECYTSALPELWDFTCTASTTTCNDQGVDTVDDTMLYECEFSLWYVADPTDSTDASEVQFPNQSWFAGASVVDKDSATSTFTRSDLGVDVIRFPAFALNDSAIPFGTLEPGEDTGTLSATTTIIAAGNTGIDQELEGSEMCPDFDPGGVSTNNECAANTATQIIPSDNQRFGFNPATAFSAGTQLTPGSAVTALVNVPKSTLVATPSDGDIYWGIAVPGTIDLAGLYTGQNSFVVVQSDAGNW